MEKKYESKVTIAFEDGANLCITIPVAKAKSLIQNFISIKQAEIFLISWNEDYVINWDKVKFIKNEIVEKAKETKREYKKKGDCPF